MDNTQQAREITADDLFDVLSTRPGVVVHFDAPWNQSASSTGRALKRILDECCPRMHLVSMNIDHPKNQELAAKLNIVSIPAFAIHVDGEQVEFLKGYQDSFGMRQILKVAEASIPWYW